MRYFFRIVPCFFLIFTFFLPITQANTVVPPVMDYGNLLSESQEESLRVEIQRLVSETGFGFGVILYNESATYSDFLSHIKNTVAPTYFQTNRFVMALNLATREMIIEVNGTARDKISDYQTDLILDEVAPYFTNGNYAKGLEVFLEMTETRLKGGTVASSSPQSVNAQDSITFVAFSFGISLLIAVATTVYFVQAMNNVQEQNTATGYMDKHEFVVTVDRERFLYRNVVKIPRAQQKGGGGRSGGGGGRSSGGRSRGF